MADDGFGNNQRTVLENMHKTFLEALRHREQEILKYIAILAPALAGFVWLLRLDFNKDEDLYVFTIGILGVLLLLLLGAVYSLALGFNYRYIILQLAKLESEKCFGIRDFMLNHWPREPKDFLKRYKFLGKPWCTPPEIIKVFWIVFVVGIIVVTISMLFINLPVKTMWLLLTTGCISLIIAWVAAPIWFGYKIQKACKEEPEEWKKSLGQK